MFAVAIPSPVFHAGFHQDVVGYESFLQETVQRLAADVVEANIDGTSAVPEMQRLTVWLSAEYLPYLRGVMPIDSEIVMRLEDLIDRMRGTSGADAERLAAEAEMLVMGLP